MEILFDDVLHCPPERLVDHYRGQTLDTLPIFQTLGEFDRGVFLEETTLARDLVVRTTGNGSLVVSVPDDTRTLEQMILIVRSHEQALSASHSRYNLANLAKGLIQRLKGSEFSEAADLTTLIVPYVSSHGTVRNVKQAEQTARTISTHVAFTFGQRDISIPATLPLRIMIDVEEYRKLYADIKAHGIQEEPIATIHNDGSIVLDDGHKRAAIALHLGYDTLPVKVIGRMAGWHQFVSSLSQVYKQKKLYHPIDHPEFAGWEVARGEERLGLIEQTIGNLQGKRVLDIGSCLGHMSRWAYRKGAHVDGIEGYHVFYDAANRLNLMEGTDVHYHKSDVVRWVEQHKGLYYDAIICLSIIHNIAQQGNPDAAMRTFRILSTMAPVMYFDIGQESEGEKVSSLGLELTEANLPNFIRRNTVYRSVQYIGKDTKYHNRLLYKLTR